MENIQYINFRDSTFKIPMEPMVEELIFNFKDGLRLDINLDHMAYQIIERNCIKTVYDKDDSFAIYYKNRDNNIFSPNGLVIIEQEIFRAFDLYDQSLTRTKINKIIERIKVSTAVDQDFFSEYKPEHLHIFNFNNASLNIVTGKFLFHNLLEFEKEKKLEIKKFHNIHNFRTYFDIEYIPNFQHESKFEEFLLKILPKKQDRDTIFEFIGYCLYRSCPLDLMTFFVGEGNNGKTALLMMIKNILHGSENTSFIDFEEFLGERFGKIAAFNKYLLCQGDLDKPVIERIGFLKDFCSGMFIDADQKNKGRIIFKSFAKGLISCNHTPRPKYKIDNNRAFQRRLHLVKFLVDIPFEDIKDRDELVKECTTNEEKTYILNKALEGLKRILESKRYSNWMDVEKTALEFEKSNNSSRYYCENEITHNSELEVAISEPELYIIYVKWCKENETPRHNIKAFIGSIKSVHESLYNTRKRRVLKKDLDQDKGKKGDKKYHYIGVEFINDNSLNNIENWIEEKSQKNLSLRGRIERLFEINSDILSKEIIIKLLKNQIEYEDKELEEVITFLIKNGYIYEPKPEEYKKME